MPVEITPGLWGNLGAGIDRFRGARKDARAEREQKQSMIFDLLQSNAIDQPTAQAMLQQAGFTGQVRTPKAQQIEAALAQPGALANMPVEQAARLGLTKELEFAQEQSQLPKTKAARKAYLKMNYPQLDEDDYDNISGNQATFEAFEAQARHLRPDYDASRGQFVDPRTMTATTPAGLGPKQATPRAGGGGGGGGAGTTLNQQRVALGQQLAEIDRDLAAYEKKGVAPPPEKIAERDSVRAVRRGVIERIQGKTPAAPTGGPARSGLNSPEAAAEFAEAQRDYLSIPESKRTAAVRKIYNDAIAEITKKYGGRR